MFGKAFLWLLAIVGGVVVVRKYGPRVMETMRAKRLSADAAAVAPGKALPASSTKGVTLVPCSPGGKPGVDPLQRGVQSSPFYRWCYLVRGGDSAGTIAERIAGDSARYAEILVANPSIAKRGAMGHVVGPDAWDFAEGTLTEGTKILVPQTMNAWIDPVGQTTGGYLPWPPDPRAIVDMEEMDRLEKDMPIGFSETPKASTETADTTLAKGDWSDGFDYEGAA